jgi:hypothetical protein
MWSHKIKTYEEDLEHFVIQEHTNKSLEEFGWRKIFWMMMMMIWSIL